MARNYPALEVHWTHPVAEDFLDQLLAAVDDASPTAIEERDDGRVRIFFATTEDRTRGEELLRAFASLRVLPLDVSDEDWAVRSQAGLGAVRVGKILVVSTSGVETSPTPVDPGGRGDAPIQISIVPSMGFGTGHHASTRRCLELLQRIPVEGARVFDAGTGSGVLAIAAWRLGARDVIAADCDPDALMAAGENLERNSAANAIALALVDLGKLSENPDASLREPFDVVLANLTGGALMRYAATLTSLLTPQGRIIASGFQQDEVAAVARVFEDHGLALTMRDDEETWVGAVFTNPSASTTR